MSGLSGCELLKLTLIEAALKLVCRASEIQLPEAVSLSEPCKHLTSHMKRGAISVADEFVVSATSKRLERRHSDAD